MQRNHSPELQELLTHVEAALIRAGQNAQQLAEQTGTKLIIKEREMGSKEGASVSDVVLRIVDSTTPVL